MTNWTNHDRAALNDWLNGDLGQKFLAHLREQRPKFEKESPSDLNHMAMMGASIMGFEKAVEEIDRMRAIPTHRNVETPYVRDTHKD